MRARCHAVAAAMRTDSPAQRPEQTNWIWNQQLTRLLELGVEAFLLRAALTGIMAKRLVPPLGPPVPERGSSLNPRERAR